MEGLRPYRGHRVRAHRRLRHHVGLRHTQRRTHVSLAGKNNESDVHFWRHWSELIRLHSYDFAGRLVVGRLALLHIHHPLYHRFRGLRRSAEREQGLAGWLEFYVTDIQNTI